ncbi:MAG: Fic family protein [Acidobacteria bacterium]|nr:Fic family protein [Acidobacteriota bacterium]
MDSAEFSERKTGQLVRLPGGKADVAWAFVPNDLPPSWDWPTDLWPMLVEARARLARLDGIGRHLPNPEILLRPLQLREAQLSSQLEGTITDPQKQVLFQADPRYPTSVSDPVNAYREVFNYGRALRLKLEGSLPLSKRLIRELHSVLMDGVRGYQETPGEFRTIQVQIGHPARFVPPPPEYLSPLLDDLERYLNTADGVDPLVRAFIAHYQFEAIHPFRDGNGRVGRLLLAITIAEWCGLSSQWLYMSAFFERRKKEYMDLLLSVSTHGTWDKWIEFCLEGVVTQAKDTERRCERLLGLHREFRERLRGGSVRLSAIVDGLFDAPVVTVTNVKSAFRVTYPTARADLDKLEGLGILKPLPNTPVITYYCDPIFEVINADFADDEDPTAQS